MDGVEVVAVGNVEVAGRLAPPRPLVDLVWIVLGRGAINTAQSLWSEITLGSRAASDLVSSVQPRGTVTLGSHEVG